MRDVVRPGRFLALGAVETTTGIGDGWERVPIGRGSLSARRTEGSMRALVIDESRTMRRIVSGILGGLGFSTSEAGNGREALDLLEAGETFDLACIDWKMPVMDGFEFVTAVRARRDWRSLTLMMVTTENERRHIVRALAAGAHEYVIKPFTPDAIASKLEMLGLLPRQERCVSVLAGVDAVQVATIATEVFAAMIDHKTGLLTPWSGGPVTMADARHAWVDLSTEHASRVQLTTDVGTADDLTRALLGVTAADPVAEADVSDALGEIANIFGGNIKSLLPEQVWLTLPKVSRVSPSGDGAVRLDEVVLAWRGRPLVISLWTL